eukprot:COSAG01_NODE_7913_length_2996_cov_1.850880_1_plen_86_part_00
MAWVHERLGRGGSGVSGVSQLAASIRCFGVVHAEAGVLREAQARAFDQMIATLEPPPQPPPPPPQGGSSQLAGGDDDGDDRCGAV